MSQNEALLGELRKYLGSAQYNPQVRESEQVLALKHDLNLAARVGQQLLMQLQAAEKQNKTNEVQLEQLKVSNTRLAQENQRLAAEHELLSETLESQDAEIAQLVQRLRDATARSANLSKASQAARTLEKEVQILEQAQSDLRVELETNVQRREAAERLARSLARHVASTYKDLRTDVARSVTDAVPGDVSLDSREGDTLDAHDTLNAHSTDQTTVQGTPHKTAADARHTKSQKDLRTASLSQSGLHDAPELTNDTTDVGTELNTSASVSIESLGVHPVDTATPLRPFRPKLNRAQSHESVLSLAPPPPLFKTLMPSRQLDATLAPKAVTALSGQHSFTASSDTTQRLGGVSARDRLSQMAPDRKPRVAAESRWHFTPFRR